MLRFAVAAALILSITVAGHSDEPLVPVGVAAIDISPGYPVRLSGYGSRRAESVGVEQRIFAKALAIGDLVVLTVDNLGVPETISAEVAKRLQVPREKLAVCSSHTHSAPMLTNVAPTLFGMPIPPEHQKNIDRYTRDLTDNLEKAARAALADRRLGRLEWAKGTVSFAANRRTRGGVVDHDLPVLRVIRDGAVQALWVNYACHCTTLGGEFNKIHGDWAGAAQELIQRSFPGVTALVSIGCGADANPQPRGSQKLAEQHGEAIIREITRLFPGEWKSLPSTISAKFEMIDLPFDTLPTHEQWEALAEQPGAVGYHAQVQLRKLDAGQALPTKLAYPIQTWSFGDKLAMVFLGGEVVVDYALRLKREYDRDRLWVNAYSNDDPCYIPSKRILKEGGYEGGGAMIYYDRPTKFAPAVEDLIFATLHKQIPEKFKAPKDPNEFPPPKSPGDSLKCIQLKPGFKAELVVAEPLIASPVAIDWGADGRLWVVEMYDYPTGLDGKYKPGGRVKYLESTRGDGQYDKVTTLADDLPFPTGLMAWRGGVLVCAAPDILYLEDTKRDGKCDVRRVLFTGFPTDNYQARVNGLSLGLDGWIYGANGLLGGKIRDPKKPDKVIDIGGRDFRMKPDTGEFEPASGLTQQGRVRDDWGNWFGGDNSNLLRHFPLPDHYLRRNPHVAGPPPYVDVLRGGDADPNKLFPASRILTRFNDFGSAGRVTSACSPLIYRDELLGNEYRGNAFVCEPVHNLVTRRVLEPKGTTFLGRRAADEQDREFLASTDNWFRPVQVRTGPDGALWVVDMYRFVIEHPRWITPDRLAQLDVRAAADSGRIYRIYPENAPPRSVPRLDKLSREELVKQLESPNGPVRDLAMQLIVERKDRACVRLLEKLAMESKLPLGKMQAMCALAGVGALRFEIIQSGLEDKNAGVRRQALRVSERAEQDLIASLSLVAKDPDLLVKFQIACSLGMLHGKKADEWRAFLLADMAIQNPSEPYITAAAASSLNSDNLETVFGEIMRAEKTPERFLRKLLATFSAVAEPHDAGNYLLSLIARPLGSPRSGQFLALRVFVELARRDELEWSLIERNGTDGKPNLVRWAAAARRVAVDEKAPEELRAEAVRSLGCIPGEKADFEALEQLISPQCPVAIQIAVVERLGELNDPAAPQLLIRKWGILSPTVRSRALDTFLAHEAWLHALLVAVNKNVIPAADFGPVRTQQLLSHRNEKIRTLAAEALHARIDPDRQRLIASYRQGMKPGDAGRGRAVYEKTCAACHKLGDTGHAAGPDLAAVTDRSTEALLIAILDPNRAVDGRYVNFVASTKRGLQYSGMLQSETATSITLLGPEGKKQELLRTELEEFTNTGKSLMPDGLEKEIPPAAMADLIAYLQSLGKPPKVVPGNSPKLVTASADGVLHLRATEAEIYGGAITFEAEFGNLGMWHGEGDHAAWSLDVPRAGKYRVEMNYACDSGVAGNSFVLTVGEAKLTHQVAGTGRWSNYGDVRLGVVELAAGRQVLVVRPAGPVRGALLDLREVRLVPVK